jgi:hypothetical protein
MAISQADFYAFSQATGAPVPEDPEARARIAPQVMEWRRNQLKQPKEEGGIVDTLGKIALGAGALAAGIAGFRTLRGRQAVSPVNVAVQEEMVRRAAQPIPRLRGVTQQVGGETARPPIPRPPTQPQPSAAPPLGQRNLTGGSVFGYLPAAEEEFTAYRPDPKEMVARQVADARRQAATEGLLRAAEARRGSYQPELPGIKGTLMALRAPLEGAAEETGELVAQAESRPLSAAPAQTNLFQYVKQAAEPEGDVVDRLLTEYNQLVERQARTDRRVQSSVREYQMELQGKALRIMDELRGDSLTQQHQTKRLFNVDQAINALQSGEDQTTGRVRQQLQRNEDLDISVIDRVEDQTNNIDVAASLTPDGVPFDQAEADLAKVAEYQVSREAQMQKFLGRPMGPSRAARNIQITPSQMEAIERTIPSYSPEDVMSQPGLQISDDPSSRLREEPRVVQRGMMISPASKTSYRGITGRPDIGIYGQVPGGRLGNLEFGPGAVEASKVIINEGEERGVTTPRRFNPNFDLPKMETPEGFVYTEAALERPTRVRFSRTPLVQEATPERLESVELSEKVRRLQREGGDVQAFLDAYKQGRI